MATPGTVSFGIEGLDDILRGGLPRGRLFLLKGRPGVVKKRSGTHERTIRQFSLGPHGIEIGAPLSEFHGVLTGIPTYTGRGGDGMQKGAKQP